MVEKIEGLGKYAIVIHGPPRIEHQGRTSDYDTDEFGEGSVSIYETLEGSAPGSRFSVGHIRYAGGFSLRSKGDKTAEEFVREIKEGLVKIISGEH